MKSRLDMGIPIVKGNEFTLRTHVNIQDDETGEWKAYDLTRATELRAYMVPDESLTTRIPMPVVRIEGDFVQTDVDSSRLKVGEYGVEITFKKASGRKGRAFRKSLLNFVNCNEEAKKADLVNQEIDVCIQVNVDIESIDIGKDTVDQALRDQVAQNTADILTKAPKDTVDEDLTNLEVLELLGLD